MTASARAITNWRLRPPFYYGWLVLGMAALGTFAATGVAQIVLGGIQNLIFEDMGWDRATIAYAVTIGTLASGFLTPFVGRLVDRYGPRGLMPLGVLTLGVCLFGTAWGRGAADRLPQGDRQADQALAPLRRPG